MSKIPVWRVNEMTPLHRERQLRSNNGPVNESTDDSSYIRRHAQEEIAERQRIQWALQYQRNQAMLEKQKAREEEQRLAKIRAKKIKMIRSIKDLEDFYDDEILPSASLYPDVSKIKYLYVGTQLPCTNMGYDIPDFMKTSPDDFQYQCPFVMVKDEVDEVDEVDVKPNFQVD